MISFFTPAKGKHERTSLRLTPDCFRCKLDQTCRSKKMKVNGRGERKVMIVGEAPGKDEDIQGRPFCGKTGEFLESTLRKLGVGMRQDCWIVNSIRCRPPKNKMPPKAIGYCQPFTRKDIEELKPEVIILLGGSAVKSVIGWLWKGAVGPPSRWDGWRVPCQKINAWLCPMYHPSYVMRGDQREDGDDNDGSDRDSEVKTVLFERHLKAAFKLSGRPWKKVPDWRKDVRVIINPEEAARVICKVIMPACEANGNRAVAVDFETGALKPDRKSEIITCAISDSVTTISYPWHGKAVEATKELLLSPLPKIAHNLKYEERCVLKEFGRPVNNWQWCSMQAAHILDNRPGINSLKFQAFARLGMDSYDTEVKPYRSSKGSNEPNRLREFPLPKLLVYGGLDALLTWKLAELQRKDFGIEP